MMKYTLLRKWIPQCCGFKSNIGQKDKAKDEPVVEVDGLEGVDALWAAVRHP